MHLHTSIMWPYIAYWPWLISSQAGQYLPLCSLSVRWTLCKTVQCSPLSRGMVESSHKCITYHSHTEVDCTCPRAGPKGGEGEAIPAGIYIRTVATSFPSVFPLPAIIGFSPNKALQHVRGGQLQNQGDQYNYIRWTWRTSTIANENRTMRAGSEVYDLCPSRTLTKEVCFARVSADTTAQCNLTLKHPKRYCWSPQDDLVCVLSMLLDFYYCRQLDPDTVWRVFPRQQMAFDFAKTCWQVQWSTIINCCNSTLPLSFQPKPLCMCRVYCCCSVV